MKRMSAVACVVWLLAAFAARAGDVFLITVVDEQTGRGVPLVELTTTNNIRYVTDSAGNVAFDEPGLFGQRVFFSVKSHGYAFPKDGFGIAGRALEVTAGGSATLKIKRLNVAERLYRTTGGGIYRDTVLAGKPAPIAQPLLNAKVFGQDSTQRIIYTGKIRWFWGDTNQVAYPLGHFGMAGAVSDLPGQGGLDPSVGVNYTYFTGENGFSRPTVPGTDLRWIDGLILLNDPQGKERLVAKCEVLKSLTNPIGRKLIVWNDEKDVFDDLMPLEKGEPLCPAGHPLRHAEAGVDYVYFPAPYPLLRVRADWERVRTPAAYEGYTCLSPGSRYAKGKSTVERDAAGKVVWAWKPNTPSVNPQEQAELVKAGLLKGDEAWNALKDVETKEGVLAHAGSVHWNAFRKKFVMITTQIGGKSSLLGEVWYTESDRPEGPYTWGRKVVTHDKYTFYNPVHHPFFDQDGGRLIYFEGTYCNTFSGNPDQTPRYDYNQVMYRLDLSDPRLKLPD